jgi:hypothetical protein
MRTLFWKGIKNAWLRGRRRGSDTPTASHAQVHATALTG